MMLDAAPEVACNDLAHIYGDNPLPCHHSGRFFSLIPLGHYIGFSDWLGSPLLREGPMFDLGQWPAGFSEKGWIDHVG